ncbi:MAG: lipopolysaccharide biosynthesis protein RfbH [Alphaproteobacteria bacterium]|nr:lipopolysaccharide biosynthesis protein RfbH [Alphaproteobacteria bacterium]
MSRDEATIRAEILDRVRELHEVRTAGRTFTPGEDYVSYAGRVHDDREVVAAVDATLDFWLTLGPHGEAFQDRLAEILGVRWTRLVNSGSSANLVALSALTSPKVDGRLRRGDEVITVAGGFPTTVAPIVQNGLVPVFLDNDPLTGNVRVERLEDALSPRTRAVMMAHTLGNPFDLDAVTAFCRDHDLFLVEDNCDALGSRWKGRLTGSFGDLSTQSFYPPHHLTMGEGGSVNIVKSGRLKVAVESFRDWGRDCWCASGKDDTCGKRFRWRLGELPEGYDHKYIYSHLGYNLKPLDIQAAIGRVQLDKLGDFTAARIANYEAFAAAIAPFAEVVQPMQATPGAQPSWFGFMMLVDPTAPFTRNELAQHLEQHKVATRMLFGGNLVRQPAFTQLARDAAEDGRGEAFRVVGDLTGADRLMHDAVFLGTYPGIDDARRGWIVDVLTTFLRERTGIAG